MGLHHNNIRSSWYQIDGKYTCTTSSNHDHIVAMIQNDIKALRDSNTQFYNRGFYKMK